MYSNILCSLMFFDYTVGSTLLFIDFCTFVNTKLNMDGLINDILMSALYDQNRLSLGLHDWNRLEPTFLQYILLNDNLFN